MAAGSRNIFKALVLVILGIILSGCASGSSVSRVAAPYSGSHFDLSGNQNKTVKRRTHPSYQRTLSPALLRDWKSYSRIEGKAYTRCLPAKLKKIVISAAKHFRTKAIITSAHRSARKNRRAGGAKRSLHLDCLAIDMKLKGVSKTALANYLRKLPGRGGLGTYCNKKNRTY